MVPLARTKPPLLLLLLLELGLLALRDCPSPRASAVSSADRHLDSSTEKLREHTTEPPMPETPSAPALAAAAEAEDDEDDEDEDEDEEEAAGTLALTLTVPTDA
jgi:hypothetical protein